MGSRNIVLFHLCKNSGLSLILKFGQLKMMSCLNLLNQSVLEKIRSFVFCLQGNKLNILTALCGTR
jgi:hypothetical protein